MRDGRFSFALGDRGGGHGGAHRSRHAAQYALPAWHRAAQCAVAAHGNRREAAHDAKLSPPWPNRHPEAIPRV